MEVVDRIIDRLGIYDLVAVLLPGACLLIVFRLLHDWLPFTVPSTCMCGINVNVVFLLLSYIVGLILQEIGSFLFNWIFRCRGYNIVIKYVLEGKYTRDKDDGKDGKKADRKGHTIADICKCLIEFVTIIIEKGVVCLLSICDPQRIRVTETEKTNNGDETGITDCDAFFNKCKWKMISEKDTARIDKEQSLSSMSRSLSLGFFSFALLIVKQHGLTNDQTALTITCILMGLALLFLARTLRFQMLRYAYVFRSYYYSKNKKIPAKEPDTSNNNSEEQSIERLN